MIRDIEEWEMVYCRENVIVGSVIDINQPCSLENIYPYVVQVVRYMDNVFSCHPKSGHIFARPNKAIINCIFEGGDVT